MMGALSTNEALMRKLEMIRLVFGIDIRAVKPEVVDSIMKARLIDARIMNGRMVVIAE
jgi:hypothetical protein